MLNPIFWKKVQGQKHPGRWETADRKIPNVKMLFKMNTNGHKQHANVSLIIIEQDTIGEPKKTTSDIRHRNRTLPKNSPIDCDGVQLHQHWTTLPVCLYIRPITRNRIKMHTIDKYTLTQSFWTGTKVIRSKHIVQPTGFGAYSSTC